MVSNSEQVLDVVAGLIAAPRLREVVDPALASRVPTRAPPGAFPTEARGTIQAGFSATSLAAADAVRESARRAFGLEQLAYRDGLTGLYNRRAFDDRFLEMSEQAGDESVMLMIDVDEFKSINDGYGHETGDEMLVAVARTILQSIRPGDFGARFGGDEFVVLLPGTTRRPKRRFQLAMYIAVSRLRVSSDRVPELIEAFKARAGLVDRYDGFVDLEVWQSDRDLGQILMVSRWLDRDRFKAYMKSEDHRTSHRRIAPDPSGRSTWKVSSTCTPTKSWPNEPPRAARRRLTAGPILHLRRHDNRSAPACTRDLRPLPETGLIRILRERMLITPRLVMTRGQLQARILVLYRGRSHVTCELVAIPRALLRSAIRVGK